MKSNHAPERGAPTSGLVYQDVRHEDIFQRLIGPDGGPLPPRVRETAALLMLGFSDAELRIAQQIGARTVRDYVRASIAGTSLCSRRDGLRLLLSEEQVVFDMVLRPHLGPSTLERAVEILRARAEAAACSRRRLKA